MRWDVAYGRTVSRVVLASLAGMLAACASFTGADQGDTTAASALPEDGPAYEGVAPRLPGSFGKLVLEKNFPQTRMLRWSSSDKKIGGAEVDFFEPREWKLSGDPAGILTFRDRSPGPILAGEVLLTPNGRAVVNVVLGADRVTYVLTRVKADGTRDRYAQRVAPPGTGWTTESAIPERRQGIWEVSDFAPGTEPTSAQRAASDDLTRRCYESALRHGWHDIEKGLADGFARPPHDPTHYRNDEYQMDDRILDPDRPEYLMYYTLDGKSFLAGFMFLARTREEHGPQIGGPLTVWHYHTWRRPQCVAPSMLPRGWARADGTCDEGTPHYRSGEMMHVWLIDRPLGPFSTSMNLDEEEARAALTKRHEEKGY